jgi:hypothetical protein
MFFVPSSVEAVLPAGATRSESTSLPPMLSYDVVLLVPALPSVLCSRREAGTKEMPCHGGGARFVHGIAINFSQDELSKVPTSRDPWALLRTVPGVQVDRVNIAGNETGQQSNFNSKGSSRNDTVWTLDGVQITDMSSAGTAPTYFDVDAFMSVTRSSASVSRSMQASGTIGRTAKRSRAPRGRTPVCRISCRA